MEMWNPENAVESEELPAPSGELQQQAIILQSPTENHQLSLTRVTPPQDVSGHKRGEEDGTEGGTEEMMEYSVDDQSILPGWSSSRPVVEIVSLLISDETNQNTSSQTGDTEESGIHKQDCGVTFTSSEADADPNFAPDINFDGDLQNLCSFSCRRCQKRFSSRQGLERHVHASCRMQMFKCRHCRKCFTTQFGRRRHERRHDNSNRRTGGLVVSTSSQSEGQTPLGISSQEGDQSKLTSQTTTLSPRPDSEGRGDSDENEETKASFACKYCKKAFGTHTNLRRHERRIHERHLLPRGVFRKVASSSQLQGQQLGGSTEASSAAGKQHGDGAEQEEEYMVDISSNISENLSFYIDGKIISTSAVTNCEVMEVNSTASAVIGLDALIISPAQVTQTLKIETNDCSTTSDLCGQPCGRRRTSTPPLLPQIKTELESESILTTSSSSSGATLIGTVLPQPLDTIVLQKEKTIYLSPKLKQLLQNQDSSKPFTLITEGQKLCPPLPLTILPAGTSRFKRRTASPPSSPQQNDASVVNTTHERDSPTPKVPEMESNCRLPVIDSSKTDEVLNLNPATNDNTAIQQVLPLDCSTSATGGRSCNQQPLDLSSTVGKRSTEVLAECVLDLSMSRKNTEADSAGASTSQTSIKRIKPSSSMLEKVLLNQYAGVDVPIPVDAGILSTPVVTDLAVMAMSEPILTNPERVLFELSLPSASAVNATPHTLNPAVLHTASPAQLPSAPASSTAMSAEVLPSAQVSIPNQDLLPLCSTAQSFISVVPTTTVEVPAENPLPAFNVSLPEWLNSAPGGVTHALIPTTPPLTLQSPQFLTDPSVCDLAQRTLVVDSVLSPDAQIFSPSLSVSQPNITSLSFPPNVVVIEYTLALESSDAVPLLQANSIHSLSDQIPPDHTEPAELLPLPQPQANTTEPLAPEQTSSLDPFPQDMALHSSTTESSLENPATALLSHAPSIPIHLENQPGSADSSDCSVQPKSKTLDTSTEDSSTSEEPSHLPPLCKRFLCNACDEQFHSMKGLSRHIGEHSDTWPYKCEFCVQLFESDTGLLEHRSSYHGIGKIYVCTICSKEFAFLCNLEQHHRDAHPGQEFAHNEIENGKLRPENHNSPIKAETATPVFPTKDKSHQSDKPAVKAEDDNDSDNTSEELYTSIKIMASEGVKPKGTDVRLGINQHYPSFKPPPFPYHNRTPAGTTSTATNFTTHNIPQTFSTAIRCTKCGKSFDNMPELHKHILACANASDKKRYTPKKNPIPLKQFAKAQNGVLSPARGVNSRQNVSQKVGHLKKISCHDPAAKAKLSSHSRRKSLWVQRSRPVGRKGSQDELEVYACPHCTKEFTYHTSLKKHMAVSCPMKPVYKSSKKRKGSMAPAQENNGSLRTRIAEVIMKQRRSNQGQKIFKKTHTNESGSANNASLSLKAHISKGKITLHNFRPKRSDVLSASAVHISKKSKAILMEGIQTPLTLTKSLTIHTKSPQPSNRVQGMGRELKQREVDVKPQPRVEEHLSQRVRERTEGPVTRSLQQVNTTVDSVPNTTNRKLNTVTLAKPPGQADSQNITAFSPVIQSKK